MLHKSQSPLPSSADRFTAAGHKAESELAFYLDRRFKGREDVHVFHDLRILLPKHLAASSDPNRDDAFQIDHLIIHKHGFILIETKSVSTGVKITQHGEWFRRWNGKWNPIASPIKQVERQADALRDILTDNKKQLREKKLFGLVQGGFKFCPMEILVAISDQGEINATEKARAGQVFKSDQIPDEVAARITRHAEGSKLTNLNDSNDGDYKLTGIEVALITNFLLKNNAPR